MQVSIHNVRKLNALSHHVGSTHWVTISVIPTYEDWRFIQEITLFFDEAKDADACAAAIGSVVVREKSETFTCERCDGPTENPEDDYGEHICDDCRQNAAEAAYERLQEAFHDGGATQFRSLQDQQIEAQKLK